MTAYNSIIININPSYFVESRLGTSIQVTYTLDPNRLPQHQMYLFIPPYHNEPIHSLIFKVFEMALFAPGTPLNEKFSVTANYISDKIIMSYSFPPQYRNVLERVARIYGYTIDNVGFIIVDPRKKENYITPSNHQNLISINTENKKVLLTQDDENELEDKIWVLKKLNGLGID